MTIYITSASWKRSLMTCRQNVSSSRSPKGKSSSSFKSNCLTWSTFWTLPSSTSSSLSRSNHKIGSNRTKIWSTDKLNGKLRNSAFNQIKFQIWMIWISFWIFYLILRSRFGFRLGVASALVMSRTLWILFRGHILPTTDLVASLLGVSQRSTILTTPASALKKKTHPSCWLRWATSWKSLIK